MGQLPPVLALWAFLCATFLWWVVACLPVLAGLLVVAAGGLVAPHAEAMRLARVRQRVVLFMEVTPSVADCSVS